MKKTKLVLSTVIALGIGFSSAYNVGPVAYASSQLLDLKIDTNSFQYSEGEFTLNQNNSQRNDVLAQVRAIRSRLWDENILYTNEDSNPNGERLQDVARANGFKTKEAYVNGLKWSNDLERIALQRAYEQTITGQSHERPDGSKYTTVFSNGVRSNGEILASSTDSETPTKAFGQWSFTPQEQQNYKSEYELLLSAKGVFNKGNGHLHLILNPEYDYIGYANIDTSDKWNYAVGQFGFQNPSGNQNSIEKTGKYTLYVGNPANRVVTKPDTTKESKPVSPETLQKYRRQRDKLAAKVEIVEDMMKKYPNTYKSVEKELKELLQEAKDGIARADKILSRFGY